MIMQTRKNIKPIYKDYLKILLIRINLANTTNENKFIYFIQFDIEELKTYTHVIETFNTTKQAKAI